MGSAGESKRRVKSVTQCTLKPGQTGVRAGAIVQEEQARSTRGEDPKVDADGLADDDWPWSLD